QVSQRLACHYGITTTTLSESLFDALTEACLLPAGALRAIVGMKLGQVSQRLACHYGITTTTLSESLFDALTEACLLP
ncbi:hypothetical protein CQA89_32835, partial [Klebsiella pneumoniae]